MGMDRREFIRLAGLSTLLGLGGFELIKPGRAEAEIVPEPQALKAKRWAMVVNQKKLDDETAKRCIAACNHVHNVPDFFHPADAKDKLSPAVAQRYEIKWIWTDPFKNAFPGLEEEYQDKAIEHMNFLLLCNHCNNPPCVRVCPTKATFQRADGIVMMDMHRCIGCRFCMAGCPFSARSFNWRNPRPYIRNLYPGYPTREIGVVEKCTFCAERLAQGLQPACVEASKGALIFGDLQDPKSEVRKYLGKYFTIRRKSYLGTSPQVYYIV